ncbi:peptidoglycan DD-metalloendopeptidase family protein [Rhodococcus sp. NPDC003994]
MARHRKPDPLDETWPSVPACGPGWGAPLATTSTRDVVRATPIPHEPARGAGWEPPAASVRAPRATPAAAPLPFRGPRGADLVAPAPSGRADGRMDAASAPGAPPITASHTTTPHTTAPISTRSAGAPRRRGAHRRPAPAVSGRTIVVSIAVGAVLSAAAGFPESSSAAPIEAAAAEFGPPGTAPSPAASVVAPPQVLTLPDLDRTARELTDQLSKGGIRQAEQALREALARRPLTASPVAGTVTSAYGPRWGSTHYGLDIANTIGTPIVSVTDGEVIEAGPADGFGLWVRIRQDDGTIGVYGHIDEALVSAGQQVAAGDLIATVGNRGQSTGPHLHYEVWQADGAKSDPTTWLAARGVSVGQTTNSAQ